MKRPGEPHLQTVEWLDGPIRICTASTNSKPRMAWAWWDAGWPMQWREAIDKQLTDAVKNREVIEKR